MRCSRCGANVVEGDRFCENCGAPVAVQAGPVCPVCGQQSEPGIRFCQQCGAELSAGPQLRSRCRPPSRCLLHSLIRLFSSTRGNTVPPSPVPSSRRRPCSRRICRDFFLRIPADPSACSC